ncbi:MAG: hypothetical protein PHZ19_11000 [Candidatus Thermoplasmatota archaeon]|nr:hypothetical protein [Candidatus Thermoplasmatota archaeon]
MAKHWSTYGGKGLSDRQIFAIDKMAKENGFADGLEIIRSVNNMSRSKASTQLADKFRAKELVDNVFEKYGRKK